MVTYENDKKYLPHNFLAEKTILSCLLISPKAVETCSKKVTIDTFYFKNHQEIYRAILMMHKEVIPIDIVTLTNFLQNNGLLNEIGGTKILIELVNQIPSLVYLEEYIKLIQDKYIRRCLIKLGYQAINSSYITNIPLENILDQYEFEVFKLTKKYERQKILSITEILSKITFDLKQNLENKKYNNSQQNLIGLTSGFYDLDLLTQGFQKSDLIILAGRPSMGKTAFCLNIALNVAKLEKLPVLVFSLEMSKEQLIYRLLASDTEINLSQIRNANLYKDDWLKLNKTIKLLSKLPLFIDENSETSIDDIRSTIKQLKFEYSKIGLILIDYLQLMQNSNFKLDNRVQELSYITRSLKILAREFKVPIIVLSQLSRNAENRINKRPILSDLRDSGSIEQDADLVLMLYRENYYNSNTQSSKATELIIAKQRNGPTGTLKLEFNAEVLKFSDIL